MSEASGNDVTTRKDGSAKPRKVAYVFYATRRTFLCQCMMAFKALKNAPRPTVRTPSLRAGVPELATALNFEIDYVLIYHHPERMDKYLLEQWVEMGGTLHEVKGLAWHWLWEDLADNDLKLYMYSLEDYERIIYLDTDALIFRHLDELFDPDVLSYHIFLAGAPLYWNSRYSLNGALIVITNPSRALFEEAVALKNHPLVKSSSFEDMAITEILYRKYPSKVLTLDSKYFILDSEWNVGDRVFRRTGGQSKPEDFSVVHFSARGKPYWYPHDQARKWMSEGKVTEEFVALYGLFWDEFSAVCPHMHTFLSPSPIMNRIGEKVIGFNLLTQVFWLALIVGAILYCCRHIATFQMWLWRLVNCLRGRGRDQPMSSRGTGNEEGFEVSVELGKRPDKEGYPTIVKRS